MVEFLFYFYEFFLQLMQATKVAHFAVFLHIVRLPILVLGVMIVSLCLFSAPFSLFESF